MTFYELNMEYSILKKEKLMRSDCAVTRTVTEGCAGSVGAFLPAVSLGGPGMHGSVAFPRE